MPTKTGSLSDGERSPLTRRRSHVEPPEARRAQLLEAAVHCFAAQGYHATAMDAIAQESGLSRASFCRQFQSKDDLLIAILDDCEAELDKRWASWEADGDPLRQLRDYGQATADQIAAQRKLTPVWIEFFHHNKKARERLRKFHASARERLSAGVRVGVRGGEVNAVARTEAADVLLAMLKGLFVLAAVDSGFDPSRRFADAWSVVEAGLRADPSG